MALSIAKKLLKYKMVKDLESFWVHRDRVGAELASLPGGERVDRFEEAVWNLQAVFEAVRPEDMEKEAWHWMCPCPAHFSGQHLGGGY